MVRACVGGVNFVLVATLGLSAPLGCGPTGSGSDSDDSETSDSSGDPTDTTQEPIPPQCMVETQDVAPHELTFSFTNASGAPVYLSTGCNLIYSIRSCVDDYGDNLALDPDCAPSCENPDEPVACPDCAYQSQIVSTDAPFEHSWGGLTYPRTNGCYDLLPAHAGRYRLVIPVYDSVTMNGEPEGPERMIELDFELPAPGGVVEVAVE